MTKPPSPSAAKRPWLDANDLKARTLIRDVLAGYDLLDAMTVRGGALVGLSPFHGGDAPSFRVDPERGIWNDFQGRPEGCKGNVIGLVQALEGCTFADALHIVAQRFVGAAPEGGSEHDDQDDQPSRGPDVEKTERPSHPSRSQAQLTTKEASSSPAPPPAKRGRRRGKQEHRADEPKSVSGVSGTRASHTGDTEDPEQAEAPLFGRELKGLRYDVPLLAERHISPKTAQTYGVGYCTRGLMKSRLVAPVRCIDGQIAGYIGRSLKPAPRTPLWKNPAGFPRSHYLFGLHRALESGKGRKAIKDYGLVVVQSPLDVLRLAQAGFANAVALMAVTASRRQMDQLADAHLNPTRRITLAFNSDEAGHAGKREAASQLIHRAFVRYACWKALDGSPSSPDRLSDSELQTLLGLKRS